MAKKHSVKPKKAASKTVTGSSSKKAVPNTQAKKAVERPKPRTLSASGKRTEVREVKETIKENAKIKSADAVPKAPPPSAVKGRQKSFERPSIELSEDPDVQKLQQKWLNLYEKSRNETVTEYNMTQTFQPKTAINHKILGWGYILSNNHDRLEVLFKDGIRFLISNYKR